MLVFKNPSFVRGEQHKLRFIKRKAYQKKYAGLAHKLQRLGEADPEKTVNVFMIVARHLNG